MFVKKQADCLSVNIDQSKVLALLFADWRAAQASTQDTQDYSEFQTWQSGSSYYRDTMQQSKQPVAATCIYQEITTNSLSLHFSIRKNHDFISENVFTSRDSSLIWFKEQFELTH